MFNYLPNLIVAVENIVSCLFKHTANHFNFAAWLSCKLGCERPTLPSWAQSIVALECFFIKHFVCLIKMVLHRLRPNAREKEENKLEAKKNLKAINKQKVTHEKSTQESVSICRQIGALGDRLQQTKAQAGMFRGFVSE